MRKQKSLVILLLFLVFSCENVPNDEELVEQRLLFLLNNSENGTGLELPSPKKIPSLNFNLRNPSYIILHHTEERSCENALQKLTHPMTKVSAHYLICKDGTLHQLVEDYARAWHAGAGSWGTISDINSVSLGIELDNIGAEPFPEEQINSLIILLKTLQEKYKIHPTNILGHGDIAPGRKKDPHCLFPWQKLANEGLAVMPSKVLPENVPDYFDPILALRFIGYDTGKPEETFQAFRRRFVGCKSKNERLLTPEEISILYDIFEKHLSLE